MFVPAQLPPRSCGKVKGIKNIGLTAGGRDVAQRVSSGREVSARRCGDAAREEFQIGSQGAKEPRGQEAEEKVGVEFSELALRYGPHNLLHMQMLVPTFVSPVRIL